MKRDLKAVNRILVLGFMGFALAFLWSLDQRPYALSWLVKTSPIAFLVMFSFLNVPGRPGRLLGLGLVFSGVGDILLELPFKGLFEAGMGAFILAHLFYIVLFFRHPRLTRGRGAVMGVMVVSTLGFAVFLFPVLGPMKLPIYVYLSVILCMGISACAGEKNHNLVIAGAAFFIFSDALIAYTRFVSPLADSSLWVMLTYYGAQALLAAGVFRSESGAANSAG